MEMWCWWFLESNFFILLMRTTKGYDIIYVHVFLHKSKAVNFIAQKRLISSPHFQSYLILK